jgi:hypothetical protein
MRVDVEIGGAEVGLRRAVVRDDGGEAEGLPLHHGSTSQAKAAYREVGGHEQVR